MGTWLSLSNVVEGAAVWVATYFVIPFVNRRFKTKIPDTPKTAQEVSELAKLVMAIWEPEIIAHLQRHHRLLHASENPASPVVTFATATPASPLTATTIPDLGAHNA